MFPVIRSFRRISFLNRSFSVGNDPGSGVNIDDADEIENMEINYNDIYLKLHSQPNTVSTAKIEDIVRPKEYKTIGDYAGTVERSLSQHIQSLPSSDPKSSQSTKPSDETVARAVGRIYLGRDSMAVLEQNEAASTVKTVAQVAGILAAIYDPMGLLAAITVCWKILLG